MTKKATYTPMMKHYLELKEQHEDAKTVSCFTVWVIFMKCFSKMQRRHPVSLIWF